MVLGQLLEVKSPVWARSQQLWGNAAASVSPITWLGAAAPQGSPKDLRTSTASSRHTPTSSASLRPRSKKEKRRPLNLEEKQGPGSHARPGPVIFPNRINPETCFFCCFFFLKTIDAAFHRMFPNPTLEAQ